MAATPWTNPTEAREIRLGTNNREKASTETRLEVERLSFVGENGLQRQADEVRRLKNAGMRKIVAYTTRRGNELVYFVEWRRPIPRQELVSAPEPQYAPDLESSVVGDTQAHREMLLELMVDDTNLKSD